MKRFSLLFLAACGNVSTTPAMPGDPGDRPDAGTVVVTPDGGSPDAGTVMPPPDGSTTATASITVIAAAIKDERGDAISFATGEPIHTHAGPAVNLGGSGCPDVYVYPYLHDATAPAFGGETSANPLAWQLAITGGTASYRVRADDGTQLVDWTVMTGDTIVLRRSAIPKLGTRDGGMFLDVKVGDAMQTFCWKHHPLAAPIELLGVAQETAGEPLWGLSLAHDGPLSDLLQVHSTVPRVIAQRFVQHTTEPIALDVTLAPPAGHFTKTVATWYAKTASGTLACGTSENYSDDPRCEIHTLTNTMTPASGTLASGTWSVQVIDEATGAAACSASGLHASCAIPPRAVGTAPHTYRVIASVDAMADLWPAAAGPFAEYNVLGRTYTGLAPVTVQRCDARSMTTFGTTISYACAYSTLAKIVALDQATLAFDPFAIAYQAGTGTTPLAALPYAPAPQTSAALSWDSGVDLLPGQ